MPQRHIVGLHEAGWSYRAIAWHVGHNVTVARYFTIGHMRAQDRPHHYYGVL